MYTSADYILVYCLTGVAILNNCLELLYILLKQLDDGGWN